ncbi:MAG: hypothetical protein JOZ93_15935 [Sinobacteraceae bacterium]|nr:hypothetical protein [Nevskiaceae bacterium]
MTAASLGSIMRDQVALSITSFDRLYLGGYDERRSELPEHVNQACRLTARS